MVKHSSLHNLWAARTNCVNAYLYVSETVPWYITTKLSDHTCRDPAVFYQTSVWMPHHRCSHNSFRFFLYKKEFNWWTQHLNVDVWTISVFMEKNYKDRTHFTLILQALCVKSNKYGFTVNWKLSNYMLLRFYMLNINSFAK